MRRTLCSLITIAIILFVASPCWGAEKVAFLKPRQFMAGETWLWNGVSFPAHRVDETGHVFSVYTVAEIDSGLQPLKEAIAANRDSITQVSASVPQQIAKSEALLRRETTDAINALPAKILADAAAQAIKSAIVQDLRAEMDSLRRQVETLQQQLDEQRRNQRAKE